MKRAAWGAAALAVVALAWATAQPGDEAQTVSGFRVPSIDKDGNLTSQMFGDSARILPNGLVDIAELRMEFYVRGSVMTNRQIDMRITSPRCVYNRASGVATSEAPVRIARDNMVVTGTGFRWVGSEERLEIYSEAKVVLKDVKRNINSEAKP
ncbi:MAG TPA: LPS export ABC transporter periplasmic protein LptC [Kiritimatiellia bacterium]|nr:LPS export ABC transporter periplasmic protein LptC [Kiritimatiellia bacterium]